ncbi:MAG: exodeoxyribonuclease VII small subunit [Chloroflexi bacterium]|nr:exodeoxyribonuclease VII small subunit [Chloroflexota bacterium]
MAPRTPSPRDPARSDRPAAGEASPPTEAPDDSFEAVYERLEEISRALEAGGLTLERSVDLYEEGMRLAQRCQELLASVEQRIETLRQRALNGGGEPR